MTGTTKSTEQFKDQAVAGLQKIYLFKGLNKVSCRSILDATSLVKYKDKEVIFSEGDNCEYFLVVVVGKVDIVIAGKGCVNQLSQGAVCGEFGILLNTKRSASAIAKGGTVLLKIRKSDLRKMLDDQPRTVAVIMQNLAGTLAKQVIDLTKN